MFNEEEAKRHAEEFQKLTEKVGGKSNLKTEDFVEMAKFSDSLEEKYGLTKDDMAVAMVTSLVVLDYMLQIRKGLSKLMDLEKATKVATVAFMISARAFEVGHDVSRVEKPKE